MSDIEHSEDLAESQIYPSIKQSTDGAIVSSYMTDRTTLDFNDDRF